MSEGASLPLLEIGVIIAGKLDPVDGDSVDQAVQALTDELLRIQPRFSWRLPQVRRADWVSAASIEPVELLSQAREERDLNGWDFAIVITAADLVSHYKPFSFAVTSRALDVAVISTTRIDPAAEDPATPENLRTQILRDRIKHLVLHSIGHWSGMSHHPDTGNVMHDIQSMSDVGTATQFTDRQRQLMTEKLELTADKRLEERSDVNVNRAWRFSVRAAWENRGEIFSAVMQAHPWQFPVRLSRFATASISTILVLLMTAETWDMAMNQTPWNVVLILSLSLVVTTGYICHRQQLLIRRSRRPLTEQIVVSNFSAVLIVAVGTLTMSFLLFVLGLLFSWWMFPAAVAETWAASLEESVSTANHLLLAGTVSSLGILIGALGATFENQNYFRHVIFVDEEI